MRTPELSVIIPAHNAERTILPLLEVLLSDPWTGEFEVLVADNRSADGTAALVRSVAESDHRVRLISAPGRRGPAHARNTGMRASKGNHLAFCDADDLVAEGWVSAMGAALRAHDLVTGPLDVDRLNPQWLARSRGRSFTKDVMMWRNCVPCIRSGNFGIKRSVLEAVDGFDESFRTGTDVELSIRLWLAGVEIHYVPDALVHYRYQAATASLWDQGRRFGEAQVRLWKLVRDLDGPLPDRFAGWRSWLWLVRRLASSMTSKEGRVRWLWVAANKAGVLQGVVRHRTLIF